MSWISTERKQKQANFSKKTGLNTTKSIIYLSNEFLVTSLRQRNMCKFIRKKSYVQLFLYSLLFI